MRRFGYQRRVDNLSSADDPLPAIQQRIEAGEATQADLDFIEADAERITRKAITEAMTEDRLDYQHAVRAVYRHLREREGLPPAAPADMYQSWGRALTEARYEVRGWCHAGWARCTFCQPGIGRDFPPDGLEDPYDVGHPHYVDALGVMETEGILPHQIQSMELEVLHDLEHAGPARGCRQCMYTRAAGRVYADERPGT